MSYRVVLQGKEEMMIDDEKAARLIEAWKSKQFTTFTIGFNTVALSTIKGVFKVEHVSNAKNDADWHMKNADWNNSCRTMAAATAEDKTEREINVRILGGYRACNREMGLALKSKLRDAIAPFFAANPGMPRCPAKVWWDLVKADLAGTTNGLKWFEYVARNDGEIARWAKFDGIKVIFNYQNELI